MFNIDPSENTKTFELCGSAVEMQRMYAVPCKALIHNLGEFTKELDFTKLNDAQQKHLDKQLNEYVLVDGKKFVADLVPFDIYMLVASKFIQFQVGDVSKKLLTLKE